MTISQHQPQSTTSAPPGRDHPTGTPVIALKHALKDAELAAQAAQATGATLTLTSALLPRWRDAAAHGHADDDLSAVYLMS